MADVLALPANFVTLPAFVQNTLIGRLLLREPNGQLPDMDEDEFAGADALALHRIVTRCGLREKVFAQLAGDEDEKEAADAEDGEGKSR